MNHKPNVGVAVALLMDWIVETQWKRAFLYGKVSLEVCEGK